jgi:hypothetical protein
MDNKSLDDFLDDVLMYDEIDTTEEVDLEDNLNDYADIMGI